MVASLPLRFVSSFACKHDMPTTRAETALVGRSNVGKSSLLNVLAQNRKLARTSKTPGATRLLNAYELEPEGSLRWIVDMPGYGYGQASKVDQSRWNAMAEEYLLQRESLGLVLHLIDAAIGPTQLDLKTVDWLNALNLPVNYIATKVDKIRPSRMHARRRELANKLGLQQDGILWVSSTKKIGIPELRAHIVKLLKPAT